MSITPNSSSVTWEDRFKHLLTCDNGKEIDEICSNLGIPYSNKKKADLVNTLFDYVEKR